MEHNNLSVFISGFEILLDEIAQRVHGEYPAIEPPEYSLVFIKIFTYCFNTYKAIGLLLRDLYYEQGGALLRILWESAANLHWISAEPVQRSKLFLQFTVLEYKRYLQNNIERLCGKEQKKVIEQLSQYETAAASILHDYRFVDSKGRNHYQQRFSGINLDSLIKDLGQPWTNEYKQIYPLLCHYSHAAPGAVIFPHPLVDILGKEAFEEIDIPRTIVIGKLSMEILDRVFRLFGKAAKINDIKFLADINSRVKYMRSA